MDEVKKFKLSYPAQSLDDMLTMWDKHPWAISVMNGDASGSAYVGLSSFASGLSSFAAGAGVRADSAAQFAHGRFNVIDTAGKFAEIVGGGTWQENRKNIYTLDWDGNAQYAGAVGCSSVVIKSSTPGSSKKFRLSVDDSGNLSAVPI